MFNMDSLLISHKDRRLNMLQPLVFLLKGSKTVGDGLNSVYRVFHNMKSMKKISDSSLTRGWKVCVCLSFEGLSFVTKV